MNGSKARSSLVSVLLGLFCLCCSAAPAVAGTPASGFQVATGSDGSYQYQVPTSWTSVPQALSTFSIGTSQPSTSATGISFRVDTVYGLPDGSQSAGVIVATITGPTPPTDRLLAGVRGGLLGIGLVSEVNGGSSMNIFDTPHFIGMPNADAAATGTGDFVDPDGFTRVVSFTAVQVGKTDYEYLAIATEDFYETPTFETIVNSFHLTPAAPQASSRIPSGVN